MPFVCHNWVSVRGLSPRRVQEMLIINWQIANICHLCVLWILIGFVQLCLRSVVKSAALSRLQFHIVWRQQPRKVLARTINYRKFDATRCVVVGLWQHLQPMPQAVAKVLVTICISLLACGVCACGCVAECICVCVATRCVYWALEWRAHSIRAASCNNNEDCRQTDDDTDAIFVSGSCCHCKHHETD